MPASRLQPASKIPTSVRGLSSGSGSAVGQAVPDTSRVGEGVPDAEGKYLWRPDAPTGFYVRPDRQLDRLRAEDVRQHGSGSVP